MSMKMHKFFNKVRSLKRNFFHSNAFLLSFDFGPIVLTLRENCPYSEFSWFALRKKFPYSELFSSAFFLQFPHLDWLRRDTEYFLRIWTFYTQCRFFPHSDLIRNTDWIQSEYRKMQTRKVPNMGTFYVV